MEPQLLGRRLWRGEGSNSGIPDEDPVIETGEGVSLTSQKGHPEGGVCIGNRNPVNGRGLGLPLTFRFNSLGASLPIKDGCLLRLGISHGVRPGFDFHELGLQSRGH